MTGMAEPRVPSRESLTAMRRGVGAMATSAAARVEADHAWFAALSAEDRSWIGVIAHGGITSFLSWLENPHVEGAGAIDVFADAPSELTRSISLEQTLDLLRTVIEIVEDEAPALARADERAAVREAVLRYSREVAFGAAHVYARAAESRGAWDARLESLVVDAVVRGEPDETLGSRVNALGWAEVRGVTVVVGGSPLGSQTSVVDPLRRAARHAGLEILVSVEGRRMIAVVGGLDAATLATPRSGTSSGNAASTSSQAAPHADPLAAARLLADHFGDGPLVCGPRVPHLYAAGRSARDALRGYDAAPAATSCRRPVHSDDLLAARAVSGDDKARRALAARVTAALQPDSVMRETARAYIRLGSLEATARELFVHANTVRYRLGRTHDLTGYDLTCPEDAFAIRLGLMYADLDAARSRPRTRPDASRAAREQPSQV